MSSPAFDNLRSYLKDHSGYALEPGKEYVLESRRALIAEKTGITDMDALAAQLRDNPQGRTGQLFIQAMTINETMFFRDGTPFDNLERHLLPALTKDRAPGKISIWCTACSSGQEPYSVAMVIDQVRHLYPQWEFEILASDLSEEMVARGVRGFYKDFEVERGLTPPLRDKYFTKVEGGWQISPAIQKMVKFKPMNLFKIDPAIGPFDIVMCRNVLIYFDVPQKKEVLQSLRKITKRDGYLMAGAAEVLTDLTDEYQRHPEWKAVYQAL